MGDCRQMGKLPEYATTYPGQLSLLPSAGWEMSTRQSVVMHRSWGVKAGIHTWIKVCGAGKIVCQPENFTDEYHTCDKQMSCLLSGSYSTWLKTATSDDTNKHQQQCRDNFNVGNFASMVFQQRGCRSAVTGNTTLSLT